VSDLGKIPAILLVAVLLMLSGSGCEQSLAIGQEIDNHLNTIIANPEYGYGVSSNPNDYIKNNQHAYDSIVSQGNRSLDYLTSELSKSNQSGLKEWIMAKACGDILKDQNPVKEWSTGKE
jgi:hypothetical protein